MFFDMPSLLHRTSHNFISNTTNTSDILEIFDFVNFYDDACKVDNIEVIIDRFSL